MVVPTTVALGGDGGTPGHREVSKREGRQEKTIGFFWKAV
jgi:hypothetical protein